MSPAALPFAPPHCPFRDCDSHTDPVGWRAIRKGFFARQARPRKIQRYRCSHCRRSFSSQTFSTTYWLRQPQLQPRLFFRILACSGFRQIAWELGVAPSTVQRQVERLGRHCLLLHEQLRPASAPEERLVLDGLRSFEFGQYWPFDVNLLIGQSHFVYGFQDAELRRSGTMTRFQRRKRRRLERQHGRPDPGATRKSVQELLTRQLPPGARVALDTDEHKAYPQALRRLSERAITHRTTSSKAARTPQNPLFPANLGDLLIRHSGANQKRETIAFSKRRQGALYRLAIWVVARNYLRPASLRRKLPPPGVAVGAIARPWNVSDVLRARLLPWRFALSGWLAECYFGRIPTRRMPRCRTHTLKYAA
jgi:transposase-like protein